MIKELWAFFKPVLMAKGFSYYIEDFDSVSSFIEIVPVIVELNKMGVSIKESVDDPLKLLIAGGLRYRNFDLNTIKSTLELSAEDSMNMLRTSGFSDKDIVLLLRNFEKVLNCFDYSSIEKVIMLGDLTSAKNELLNCFVHQLIGGSKPSFNVSTLSYNDLLKVFRSKTKSTAKIELPETLMVVDESDKLVGYFMKLNGRPVVISHKALLSYGYTVIGCTNKYRGTEVENGFKINNSFVNKENVTDVLQVLSNSKINNIGYCALKIPS